MKQEQLSKGSDLYGKIKNLKDDSKAINEHINNGGIIKYGKLEISIKCKDTATFIDTFSTNMSRVTPEMQSAIITEIEFFAHRIKYIYDKQIKIFQDEFDNL